MRALPERVWYQVSIWTRQFLAPDHQLLISFELMWLEDRSLAHLIKSRWSSIQVQGWQSYRLCKKLQVLKRTLGAGTVNISTACRLKWPSHPETWAIWTRWKRMRCLFSKRRTKGDLI
ncbi:hypothetical protein AMTR_s00017p00139180 [Amborella trichopoda]|uniref:Uncharacterized protein n=1 Tax=Amborella trichopoda TaxID=13333 RepID=W1PLE2_AMBTC|nr:hypothetical protein AMTR_s00017p00139180 [Amborella trichopoda]